MVSIRTCVFVAVAAFILSFIIGLVNRNAMPLLIIRPLLFAALFFVISAVVNYLVKSFLPELLEEGGGHEHTDFFPGSRIDITEGEDANLAPGGFVGDAPSLPAFMNAQADNSTDSLDNISALASKKTAPKNVGGMGMDQNAQNGYNAGGVVEEQPVAEQFTPWEPMPLSVGAEMMDDFVPERPPAVVLGVAAANADVAPPVAEVPGGVTLSDSEDFFPDLDSMAGAFSSSSSSVDRGADSGGHSPLTAPSRRSRASKDAGWADDFNAKDIAAGLRTVLNKEKEG